MMQASMQRLLFQSPALYQLMRHTPVAYTLKIKRELRAMGEHWPSSTAQQLSVACSCQVTDGGAHSTNRSSLAQDRQLTAWKEGAGGRGRGGQAKAGGKERDPPFTLTLCLGVECTV